MQPRYLNTYLCGILDTGTQYGTCTSMCFSFLGGFFGSLTVPWLGDLLSYFSFNLVLLVWLEKSTDPFTGCENMNPGSDKKKLRVVKKSGCVPCSRFIPLRKLQIGQKRERESAVVEVRDEHARARWPHHGLGSAQETPSRLPVRPLQGESFEQLFCGSRRWISGHKFEFSHTWVFVLFSTFVFLFYIMPSWIVSLVSCFADFLAWILKIRVEYGVQSNL